MTPSSGTAALWLRVSTKEQTVENQEQPLRELAHEKGWKIVELYDQTGRSAFAGKHMTGIEEALADAHKDKFDHLIVWSIDRLSRQGIEATFKLVRDFREAGAEIVSLQEPWIERTEDEKTNNQGDVFLALKAYLAQEESRHKGERVKAARERLIVSGKWPGGNLPHGYARVGGTKLPIEDSKTKRHGAVEAYEPEAKLVRLVFHLYVDERLGTRSVANYLNENGHGRWRESTVGRILRRDYRGGPHHKIKEVELPQIIDVETWNRAKVLLDTNRRKKSSPQTKSPLQGLISCNDKCGGKWRIATARPGHGQHARYYCVRREKPRPGTSDHYETCQVPRLPLEPFHKNVLTALREAFSDYDKYIGLLTRSLGDLKSRIIELERKAPDVDKLVIEIQAEKKRVVRIYRRGMIQDAEFERDIDALEAKEAALRDKYPKATERQAELDTLRALRTGLSDMIKLANARKEHGIPAGVFSMNPVAAVTDEAEQFVDSVENPLQDTGKSVEDQLDVLVKRLDIGITIYPDHAELTGTLPMMVPLPPTTDSPYAVRYGRGLG